MFLPRLLAVTDFKKFSKKLCPVLIPVFIICIIPFILTPGLFISTLTAVWQILSVLSVKLAKIDVIFKKFINAICLPSRLSLSS